MRPAQSPPVGELTAPDACQSAGITYRQLDWWIRNGSIPVTEAMRAPGSGNYRRVPDWYVPRLRLLGRLQAELHPTSGRGALDGTVLRRVFDNYESGRVSFGAFALIWKPDRSHC